MSRTIPFTKMHGAGNDYIYVNTLLYSVPDPGAAAIAWSKPHFGIGSDGLVLIGRPSNPDEADYSMRIFNADGSEAMMCGNASRCIGKYVYERGLTKKTVVRLETLSGVKVLRLHLDKDDDTKVDSVTVDMLAPAFDVPAQFTGAEPALPEALKAHLIILGPSKETSREINRSTNSCIQTNHLTTNHTTTALDHEDTGKALSTAPTACGVTGTFVSMGNPHYVFFVDDVSALDIAAIGRQLEFDPAFPERCNIEFAQPTTGADGVTTLRTRVWERGSGITMACGTGACATTVAAISRHLTDRAAQPRTCDIVMDGGTLHITWDNADNHVYMTGPAAFAFDGIIPLPE